MTGGNIGELNPRLALSVTSTKSKRAVAALARVSLERIHFLDFVGGVMGGQAAQIDDASFRALVPSLAGVRNLALSCVGDAGTCFSPGALQALGEASAGIEYLRLEHLDYSADGSRPALRPLREYVEVIATGRAFKELRALYVPFAEPALLWRSLPKLVVLETYEDDGGARSPTSAAELAEVKSRPRPKA